MKTLFTLFWLAAVATASHAHELPKFGAVPKLSDEWKVRERETQVPMFNGTLHVSYLVLTNSKTGDFLSFCEEKLDGEPFSKANRVPWSDMAGARFPGGYTTWHQPDQYKPLAHWIRNDIVDLAVVHMKRNTNYKEPALEYTLIFENPREPARIAHGYIISMGEFRIQVQHTSTNVITSDFAHSITSAMLSDYVNREKPIDVADASLTGREAPVSSAGRPHGEVHIDKTRKGETSVSVEQANPKHGLFEQKTILDETGEILHWQQDFVDENGKVVVQVLRKAMGHDVPVHEGVQYINHHTYRPDGERDTTVEFFGDGRIRKRTVNRYDEKGTLLGADVFRDGKKVGWVHGALSAPPKGFPPRGERGSSNRSREEKRE
jgi:hypothetical protein